MEAKQELFSSVKHFAHALFIGSRGEDEDYKFISLWVNSDEYLTLTRVEATLTKMNDIYGMIFQSCFEWYFVTLKEDKILHSKKDLAKFLLVRSYHFCRSPSFYDFLLVCLFMLHLLKSQPQCLSLLRVVTKCLMMVFKERYDDFFMANGGLTGMRKYFDEIQNEDLRLFTGRHANSENGGILIPTYEDVFKIVTEFDKDDFKDFHIDLQFLYRYYYPDDEEKNNISTDKLKLSSLPPETDDEDENRKIEQLIYKLGINSKERENRAHCWVAMALPTLYDMCQSQTIANLRAGLWSQCQENPFT
ncbi:hypothetical protein CDAR_106791 [Caerostris darwini]|uniref:Uncharacterized protein n=1 Tax=Caerostris darwini TaxID=1538125 RepID=A0AAV4MPQ6_9ARAC|nr:hypothetical protein CDAR_106791 [Caerostris darwini]